LSTATLTDVTAPADVTADLLAWLDSYTDRYFTYRRELLAGAIPEFTEFARAEIQPDTITEEGTIHRGISLQDVADYWLASNRNTVEVDFPVVHSWQASGRTEVYDVSRDGACVVVTSVVHDGCWLSETFTVDAVTRTVNRDGARVRLQVDDTILDIGLSDAEKYRGGLSRVVALAGAAREVTS